MAEPLDPQYTDQIKGFEGYAPTASWDYKQNSNGYGTKALYPGETIDRDTAEQRFQTEIAKAQAHVESVAPDAPPGVKAALTSLTYNAGPGWSQSGLGDLVRAGDWAGAAERFQEYNKAGGQVNPGLVSRRAKESAWFNAAPQTDVAQAPQPAPIGGAPATPQPTQPPLNLASFRQAALNMPAFGWSPQAQPQAQQPQRPYGDVGAMEQPQMPGLQAPQIQYAQRRQPDLRQLQAFLQARAPGFSRG